MTLSKPIKIASGHRTLETSKEFRFGHHNVCGGVWTLPDIHLRFLNLPYIFG